MRFLLNWLMNHLLFAGTMFFAAGATAIGGGDAAVQGRPVAGSGGDDTPTDDTPADESVAGATEDQQPTDDTLQDESQDQQPQVASSEQIKSHIEELKKTNPALAKELKNTFFMVEALKKEFPGGLPELRQVKQTIEELGGSEGIEGLKAERAEWNTLDDKFINGDVTVLDDFAKFNPESFAKIAPAVLDKLATIDKAAYDHKLSGIFAATLDNWRFFDTLDRVAESIGRIVDDKGQPMCARELQLLQGLAKNYDEIKKIASTAPVKATDDGKSKIDAERAEIAAEKARVASEYVGNATQFHAQKQYDSVVPAEARSQKLDLERMKAAGSYDRMMRQIDEEIGRAVSSDKAFLQKMGTSLAAGRRDEAVKLSNSKFDAVVGEVVKHVIREYATLMNPRGPAAKSNANSANGTKPSPAGVKKLESAPDLDMVDKTVPGWRDDYMMNSKAKLKTGQRVEW